jgi:hypothetical protein
MLMKGYIEALRAPSAQMGVWVISGWEAIQAHGSFCPGWFQHEPANATCNIAKHSYLEASLTPDAQKVVRSVNEWKAINGQGNFCSGAFQHEPGN